MTELLTAAQMRAIEQVAIASGEVTGLELMERAGQGVVDAIFEEWPELADGDRRAVVLCGPGNNGGDGFVVARLLKEVGWEVEVFLYGDPEKLPPDAKVNYERWVDLGEVSSIADPAFFQATANLWIDAIFGIGLSREVPEPVYWALDHMDAAARGAAKTIAIDMPSWFASDTGAHLGRGHGAKFDMVVTFATRKLGHVVGVAKEFIHRLRQVDLGIPCEDVRGSIDEVDDTGLSGILAKGVGFIAAHKYSHGHAFVLSGGVGKGGAARLAARGALRIGAGAATIGCPPSAFIENAAQLNAVMLKPIKGDDVLTNVLQDERINALCIGPGLGLRAREGALVSAVLVSGNSCVLDADALTLLAQDETLVAKLHEQCVLTPHAGEFARLFPDIAEKLDAPAAKDPAYSKVDATRAAAKRAGCVVLFKGPDTVIADPSGRCSINASVYERSAPWLATAGSGDVVAGFITGLLARGFRPMQAAETGAWLHTECALSFGPGLIAEDLAEELPKVFRALEI